MTAKNVLRPFFPSPACDTCEQPTPYEDLFFYALPGIPASVGNCQRCWREDLYPLWAVVGNTAAIGGWDHASQWWKGVVTRSLPVLDLSFEEFQERVAMVIKQFEEAGGFP